MVLCEGYERCTTNFHGTVLSWPNAPIESVIWLRCILEYYRYAGFLAFIAVGGQGGHLSPDYFEYIPIPKFPMQQQMGIARLYHNPSPQPGERLGLKNFVDWHKKWNSALGIWELDRELKNLQAALVRVQETIIQGKKVDIPF